MTDNFVYDNVVLPGDPQADRAGHVVTDATTQFGALHSNAIYTALKGLRTVLGDQHANVRTFGAVADGVADDTSAIQAAITATAGQPLYFPRGTYKVSSTLFIASRSHMLVGDFPARGSLSGTEIAYSGTGPCIQIGTDSGNAWSANEYDGFQDHIFQNLRIRHSAPDTNLVSTGVAGNHYKAGAYGLWDWRGGGIRLIDCGFEHFEANFVGIQSDINTFINVENNYSKYGFYLGPRSDQNTIISMSSIFCDRAVTIDLASGTRIIAGQFVGCGHSTASGIEVRRASTNGTFGVVIDACWFETGLGYQGTDKLSFVSVGEVNGYGAGGSISSPGGAPSTATVAGCVIRDPQLITILGGVATHVRFLASVGKCQRFLIENPSQQNSGSLTNFDALVGIQASQAPTNAETQITIRGVSSTLTTANLFSNLGAGTPAFFAESDGASGKINTSSQRWHFRRTGAVTGADEFWLSQENNSGEFWINTPNKASGQTTRLRIARSRQTTFVSTGPPTSGTWEVGDRVDVLDATQTGYAGFYCWIAGTPGTWAPYGKIEGRELVPAQLTGNADNYTPTSASVAKVFLLNSSIAVDITGLVAGLVVAGSSGSTGEEVILYNDGAQNITLKHQNASSAAANRFIGIGNADVVLTPAHCATLYYSPSKTRWLITAATL